MFYDNGNLEDIKGIIRGKMVFIGDYSMKPRLINRLKAEAKPRPFNVLSTEAE